MGAHESLDYVWVGARRGLMETCAWLLQRPGLACLLSVKDDNLGRILGTLDHGTYNFVFWPIGSKVGTAIA